MLQAFQKLIQSLQLTNKKFLLAVSAGVDSMVMSDLFYQSGLYFAIVHCNYHLRGDDSNNDEKLVYEWCSSNNITLYKKDFIVSKQDNIQLTARQLRYQWFDELKNKYAFDYIVTAHHQDDTIETVLMNFFKGTGIAGMRGIQTIRDQSIFRPLLHFSKKEIYKYAEVNNIVWREDVSNAKNDYTRNQIRNIILPKIEESFPNVRQSISNNIQRFSEVEVIYKQSIDEYKKRLLEYNNEDVYISILKLKRCNPLFTIVYEMLVPFGFDYHQTAQIINLLDAETGKYLSSTTHRIIKNRNVLIITSLKTEKSTFVTIDIQNNKESQLIATNNFEMHVHWYKHINNSFQLNSSNDRIAIDADKLKGNLVLRKWKQGDYFYPFGMGMKKKKISKLLIDAKVPLHEKENIWVVECDSRIVWVVGFRLDERFKITPKTGNILELSIHKPING